MFDVEASLAAIPRQYAQGCVKTIEDLSRYEEVIAEVKPDLIIECGTFSGKSALWFARTAGCTVVTIDTTPYIDPDVEEAWREHTIYDFVGSSTDPEIIDHVLDFAEDAERIMVTLDSDHSAPHVSAEIAAYSPMVSVGSYMVVEDGLLRYMPDEERKHYTGNPLDAIEAFMKGNTSWELNEELQNRYPVTQFPGGWLRRTV